MNRNRGPAPQKRSPGLRQVGVMGHGGEELGAGAGLAWELGEPRDHARERRVSGWMLHKLERC